MRRNDEGLKAKYIVHKAETGEEVNNCFVLRPDRDAAAVTAIRAYAAVTGNKTLAADLIRWVGVEPNDPLTLEELREMDGEWVFCVSTAKQEDAAWGIVRMRKICPYVSALWSSDEIGTIFSLATYGSMWLAYRHKPKEKST